MYGIPENMTFAVVQEFNPWWAKQQFRTACRGAILRTVLQWWNTYQRAGAPYYRAHASWPGCSLLRQAIQACCVPTSPSDKYSVSLRWSGIHLKLLGLEKTLWVWEAPILES